MLIGNSTTNEIITHQRLNKSENFYNIALVPTGSLEQHGSLLPLNTDTVLSTNVCTALDDKSGGRFFVYPEIIYTNTLVCKNYPGTVSISHDTFRSLIREVAKGIINGGFDACIFIDGHSINKSDLFEVSCDLVNQSFDKGSPKPIAVIPLYDYFNGLAKKYNISLGKHADIMEMILFIGGGGILKKTDQVSVEKKEYNWPGSIPGVPIELRSDNGVIGEIVGPLESAALVWNDLIEIVYNKLLRDVELFYGCIKEKGA